MFLTSARPTIRFAAVKTLNRVRGRVPGPCWLGCISGLSHSHSQIAMIHPDAVTSCNVDLESLISDNNRSIATLAITTLLKVCGWDGGRVGVGGEGGGGRERERERESRASRGRKSSKEIKHITYASSHPSPSLRRAMRRVLSG